jgi:hypothetical protein
MSKLLAAILFLPCFLHAQSLDVKNPSPLKPGLNKGSVDSLVGEQFWYFIAEPGKFRVVFSSGGTQEGFSVGGKTLSAAAFAPSNPHGKITFKESPNTTVMEGTTEQRWKVVVVVEPHKSPLVRQTSDYTLTVSGNASFVSGNAGGKAPIVGTYMGKLNGIGAAKFLADGSVVSSTGQSGTWKLFDADTGIYSVVLGGSRMTLTLSPGRGLVDTGNKNLVFELQK